MPVIAGELKAARVHGRKTADCCVALCPQLWNSALLLRQLFPSRNAKVVWVSALWASKALLQSAQVLQVTRFVRRKSDSFLVSAVGFFA